MKNFILLLLFLVLSGSTGIQAQTPSETLEGIIEEIQDHNFYDRETYPLGLFIENHYREKAEYARKKLDLLRGLDQKALSETERISLVLMKFRLQEDVDQYEYKAYLNPLLSDAGFHLSLAYHSRELHTYGQVREYLKKLQAIPAYVDQHLTLLRKGLREGITQPRVIFEGYESTYEDQIVESPRESFYFRPFEDLPDRLTQQQKDSILTAAELVIEQKVIPQFQRIKKFFEEEYLPNTRRAIGISEIPRGREYYRSRVRYYTTLDLLPEDVHQIGLHEVRRINAEMKTIIAEIGFKGSFEDFLSFLRSDDQFYVESPGELLKEARDIAKRIDAKLPAFFKTLPRKPYGVAPVPDAIAPKYTTGRYKGPANETEPGYYWVNTYDLPSRPLYVLPALTAHEAVPGHHLQNALNAELGDSIPRFRREMYLSAYGEGWGLYSETLAEAMGIYTSPYERFGKLTYEQWRACRLVVDTGMHVMGWSREEAVDFMKKNTALSLHEINTETDRYISWPGQALSYKIGEIKILDLRRKAEEALGSRFDIRDFHQVILGQGVVTLPLLEERVDQFIDSQLD